jgi:hypothetical protein
MLPSRRVVALQGFLGADLHPRPDSYNRAAPMPVGTPLELLADRDQRRLTPGAADELQRRGKSVQAEAAG